MATAKKASSAGKASSGSARKSAPAAKSAAKGASAKATKSAPGKKAAAVTKKSPPAKKKATAPAVKKSPPVKKKATAPAKKSPPAKKAPAAKKSAPAKKSPAPAAKKSVPAKKAPAPAAKKPAAAKAPPAKAPVVKSPVAAPPAKKAPAKKAGKVILDKFQLKQRDELIAERETYLAQAKSLREEADQIAREAEPGDIQFDDESGEGGTMAIDRERDLALASQAMGIIDEIDHSLRKLEMGTYGDCENCGQPILKARLEALPYARLCIACKSGGLSRR